MQTRALPYQGKCKPGRLLPGIHVVMLIRILSGKSSIPGAGCPGFTRYAAHQSLIRENVNPGRVQLPGIQCAAQDSRVYSLQWPATVKPSYHPPLLSLQWPATVKPSYPPPLFILPSIFFLQNEHLL